MPEDYIPTADVNMDMVNQSMHNISLVLEEDDETIKRAIWSLIAGFLAVVEVMLEIRTMGIFQKVASVTEMLLDYANAEKERVA